MDFRNCTINGVLYGNYLKEKSTSSLIPTEIEMRQIMGRLFDDRHVSTNPLSFIDTKLHLDITKNKSLKDLNTSWPSFGDKDQNQSTLIINFFTLLAVCHTVLIESKETSFEYKAQSPDEAALVNAAKNVGFTFVKREGNRISIDIMGTVKKFEILNVLEFNSDRKRMSVIVKNDQEIILLCKGADSELLIGK